jgi:hypothetical protein
MICVLFTILTIAVRFANLMIGAMRAIFRELALFAILGR